MCVVSPVRRTEVPAPEIALGVPQVTIIDLEISKALEQRRQAYKEENHRSREINQVVLGRAQNGGIAENEIADVKTIVLDLESETEPVKLS